MEQTSRRPTVLGGVASLVLAALAMVCLAAGDLTWRFTNAESLSVLATIAGWALLAWAVIVAVATLGALVVKATVHRAGSTAEWAILAAGIGLTICTAWMYPLWGVGSA